VLLLPSRYNFFIPLDSNAALLFSAFSGAVIKVSGPDTSQLAGFLCKSTEMLDSEAIAPELTEQLVQGGFLTEDHARQFDEIARRYQTARSNYPLVLTLTTTMDCNLGCYYCYEERSHQQLELADVESIISLARSRLLERSKQHLHVDWYGGEPLLNVSFIEAASVKLQALADTLKIGYTSSLVSNGTCWPSEPGGFVKRHRIRQVQISFDGLRENHNRRRRFVSKGDNGRSSFDEAAELVSNLLEHVRVDIRFNIDASNKQDVLPFIAFARERGWFSRPYPASFQPARLSAYTPRSSFLRKVELPLSEYDDIRRKVRESLTEARVAEPEVPDGFPYPKMSVCAALAENPIVVGPDRKLYRCGLQVSEKSRSVGELAKDEPNPFRIINQERHSRAGSDEDFWASFDPTKAPKCSACSFLPICWGGCAKKHLDGDQHALDEQAEYWRTNLSRLVSEGVGIKLRTPHTYRVADQFR
jgi:uncharacterized protein